MIDQTLLKNLQLAIQKTSGCNAEYIETETVSEKKQGKVLWEADVEIFKVTGHDKAKKCFAWSYDQGKKIDYVTVLKLPPVSSAKKAVQMWIDSMKK
jgi:hypothetical protein